MSFLSFLSNELQSLDSHPKILVVIGPRYGVVVVGVVISNNACNIVDGVAWDWEMTDLPPNIINVNSGTILIRKVMSTIYSSI